MKKYLFVVVVAILAAPGLALGQSGPNGGGQQGNGQQFQEHKAKILQRLSTRLAKIQQRQSCVQAANNRQALFACMPQGQGQTP